MTQDRQILDAAAAAAAVLRSQGYDWATVQRLQSAIVTAMADVLQGPDPTCAHCDDKGGCTACNVCGLCFSCRQYHGHSAACQFTQTDLAAMAAHDQH